MSEPTMNPMEALAELRAQHALTKCVACGGVAWDAGVILSAPLSTAGHPFDWKRPFEGNDLFFAAALTCQRCQQVLLLKLGILAQTE